MDREQAVKLVQQLLTMMKQKGASDLFISAGFPPAIKLDGQMTSVMEKQLPADASALIIRSLMNDRKIKDYEATNECNFAISPQGIGRLPVTASVQQVAVGVVMRTVPTEFRVYPQ